MSEQPEIDRLRELVGPSETAYEELRNDRAEAERVARDAVRDLGELRGHIAELDTELARTRQDRDLLQRRKRLLPGELTLARQVRRWGAAAAHRAKRWR